MDSTSTSNTLTNMKNGVTQFMNSTSVISKIAFLLIVIFLFVIVLQVCLNLISAIYNAIQSSPKLFTGMLSANKTLVISGDPQVRGSVVIPRSINKNGGIEFTWSIWLYIEDLGKSDGKYKHIFHKGNANMAENGLNFPNNSPGLYMSPNSNELTVVMNTFNKINEEIKIDNVPMNKWVNVILRIRNSTLDVYINGIITKSVTLSSVPKQNYGDVFVAMNGGFSGYLSNLWYWGYALNATQIMNLVRKGPNTKMQNEIAMNEKNPNYLSMRWFWYGNHDMYNP